MPISAPNHLVANVSHFLVATGEADALSAYEAWLTTLLFGTEEDAPSLAEAVLPVPAELADHTRKADDWKRANWGADGPDSDHWFDDDFSSWRPTLESCKNPKVPHLDLTARPFHTVDYITQVTLGEGREGVAEIGDGVVAAVSALHPDLDFVSFVILAGDFRVARTYRAGQKVDERVESCIIPSVTVGDTVGVFGKELRWAVTQNFPFLDFSRSFPDILTDAIAWVFPQALPKYGPGGVAALTASEVAALTGPWSDAHLDALNSGHFDGDTLDEYADDKEAFDDEVGVAHVEALLTCILRSENVPLDVLEELHTPTGRFPGLDLVIDLDTQVHVTAIIADRSDWQEAFTAAYGALNDDGKFTYGQMRPDFDGGPFTLLRVARRLAAAKKCHPHDLQ
ncbi:MAG: hypothetical protein GY882_03880 [Actinomycetia bacterium]|nr:hypothetical protein [Actinomycetes bacterium]